MSVTILASQTVSIDQDNLQAVLYDGALIKQLARQLVANQINARIVAAQDLDEGELQTYIQAEVYLLGAKEDVNDYIADLLETFRESLYEQIRAVEVEVKSIQMSKEGMEDAQVNIC